MCGRRTPGPQYGRLVTRWDAHELPVLPGRLQRLADELNEEALPALDGASDPVIALVELAYALRPHLHEGRVPSYGVLLPPGPIADVVSASAALHTSVDLIGAHDLDLKFARRFADGVTSFGVRTDDAVDQLACFDRNMSDEHDLVGLQAAIGGLIIQRHPAGEVRVFGPAGVVRWNGTGWHHDVPMDAWIARLSSVAPDLPVGGVRPLLRFAIHKLGGHRIGATLIWRPTPHAVPPHRHESLIHNAPPLRVGKVGEEAALAHALSQTDGAAVFDGTATLTALGIRLAPSSVAEQSISPIGGMRHTSALRYSHDDPHSIVIVVSESGPVTLMHAGRAITEADPADETIG
jgi:Probable sensor domain DACNK/DisA bacterial checkpoint controller nucleotide-binding